MTNNRKRSNGTRTEQTTQQQSTARNKQTRVRRIQAYLMKNHDWIRRRKLTTLVVTTRSRSKNHRNLFTATDSKRRKKAGDGKTSASTESEVGDGGRQGQTHDRFTRAGGRRWDTNFYANLGLMIGFFFSSLFFFPPFSPFVSSN